jgi:hypothetical protein
MDDKIKSAIEIAMEKAEMLEDLSEEEKKNINNRKKLDPIMLNFYRKKLQPDKLWEKFKGEDESLMVLAQFNIIDSLKFGLGIEELLRRIKAIIALESLKKEQNTAAIQDGLNELENIKKRAEDEKNQVYDEFKQQVENNPQARTKVLEQDGAKIMLKLSVEDAIAQSKQWKQFLIDFENKYVNAFTEIIKKIRQYLSS